MCGTVLGVHKYLYFILQFVIDVSVYLINCKSSEGRDYVFDYSFTDPFIYPSHLCYFVNPCLVHCPSSGVGRSVNKLRQFDCYDRTFPCRRKERDIGD